MKALAFSIIVIVGLNGCARFSTRQIDYRYNENGKISDKIETKAAAWTFFDSNSTLTTWKATQTEKTQGATVGGLEMQASGTNAVEVLKQLNALMSRLGM